ncbi:MAG TPA: dihydrofolate reductase [Xanthobacteraceae bacterium]
MDIIIVAAVAANGVIGRDNGLPWRLKSDLMNFRAVTMGKPVVMGRKTFASLGRQLKGRTVIVVSRDPAFTAPGVIVAPTFDAALTAARGDALRRGTDAIIVAGGADIYAQALPLAARLLITEVHKTVEGDVRFPKVDPKVWRESVRNEHKPAAEDEAAFAFVTYERTADHATKRQSAA